MDYTDDTSIPPEEDPSDIERKEVAKQKAEGWIPRRICKELVLELVASTDSRWQGMMEFQMAGNGMEEMDSIHDDESTEKEIPRIPGRRQPCMICQQ